MAFLKCLLAGVVAVIGASLLAAGAVVVYFWWQGGYVGAVGWQVWPILCALLVIFAAGFWWRSRRMR